MTRTRKGSNTFIDWAGRTSSFTTLQESYSLLDRVEDTSDELEAKRAHLDEIDRVLAGFERYPYGHPKYMEALKRLAYLQSPQHAASRKVKLELKKAGRRTKHAVIVAMQPVIDLLLIVVFNVAAVMLLFWLISLI